MSTVSVEDWFAELALEAMADQADDSQEWAIVHRQLTTRTEHNDCELTQFVAEEVLEHVCVPEKRCTCFISPPCNDCVENAGTREQLSLLREWLNERR